MKVFYVYILASKYRGVLYVGITSDLVRRTYEHRSDLIGGFTKKYLVHKLVYYEPMPDSTTVIKREKQLKNWMREWKISLIEKTNPEWKDQYLEII
jgi:putative endonuclease